MFTEYVEAPEYAKYGEKTSFSALPESYYLHIAARVGENDTLVCWCVVHHDNAVSMAGVVIRRNDCTVVTFAPDAGDELDIDCSDRSATIEDAVCELPYWAAEPLMRKFKITDRAIVNALERSGRAMFGRQLPCCPPQAWNRKYQIVASLDLGDSYAWRGPSFIGIRDDINGHVEYDIAVPAEPAEGAWLSHWVRIDQCREGWEAFASLNEAEDDQDAMDDECRNGVNFDPSVYPGDYSK